MGMQLNIKGEEAYRLASRLSELTGTSLTAAVTDALRRAVEDEERSRQKDAMFRDVAAIAADIRAEFEKAGADLPSSNHDWLYDDQTGLPV